jgi:hypothetical protein
LKKSNHSDYIKNLDFVLMPHAGPENNIWVNVEPETFHAPFNMHTSTNLLRCRTSSALFTLSEQSFNLFANSAQEIGVANSGACCMQL